MSDLDPPALVVDLRARALARDRAALEEREEAPPLPTDEPLEAHEVVAWIAVLHDASDEPLLLPIEPTRDRRRLDAVARLLRFAVMRGERMPEVAVRYGEEYERRLAFERRLPAWAYDGVDPRVARALPEPLRRVLSARSGA